MYWNKDLKNCGRSKWGRLKDAFMDKLNRLASNSWRILNLKFDD